MSRKWNRRNGGEGIRWVAQGKERTRRARQKKKNLLPCPQLTWGKWGISDFGGKASTCRCTQNVGTEACTRCKVKGAVKSRRSFFFFFSSLRACLPAHYGSSHPSLDSLLIHSARVVRSMTSRNAQEGGRALCVCN